MKTMAPALLVFFLLFFAAALVWPTWRIWRREGVNALVLPHGDGADGVVAGWFRACLLAVVAMLAALSAGLPPEHLGRLAWLETPLLQVAGWAALAASLGWIVVAQAQMGRSWRIGIDARTRPPLVRTGLFAKSRNPIFLGMRVGLAALFLILPNGVTLALFVVADVTIQLQVRLEEAHLEALFGAEYDAYRRAVPRWL